MRQPIEIFHQTTDGADYAPAIQRAIASVGANSGGTILFQNKTYEVHSKIDLYRRMAFTGEESAYRLFGNPRFDHPVIHFTNPASCGLELHYPSTRFGPGTYAPDPTADCGSFFASCLTFKGPGATTGRTNHGIYARRSLDIFGCAFRDWGGDAVHIEASATNPARIGNANNCRMSDCTFDTIGRSALWISGPDTNAGLFVNLRTNNCGKDIGTKTAAFSSAQVKNNVCTIVAPGHPFIVGDHVKVSGVSLESTQVLNATTDEFSLALNLPDGVLGTGTVSGFAVALYDNCFIHNTYLVCSTGATLNGGCGIKSSGGACVYLVSYTEGNSRDELGKSSLSVFGTVSRSTSTSGPYLMPGTGGLLRAYPGIEAKPGTITTGATACLGGTSANSALEISHSNTPSSILRIQYEQTSQSKGWWDVFCDSNMNNRVPMRVSHGGNTVEGSGQTWWPNGFYVGSQDARWKDTAETNGGLKVRTSYDPAGVPHREAWATAAPTKGTWSVADKIWNSVPVAGAPTGWICITAGTPGIWRPISLVG